MSILFSPFNHPDLELKNRFVMAPMTRNRAIGYIPNALMVEYYTQRAGAGLLITEGIGPSPSGMGYVRMPGLYSQQQVAGWKAITGSVHAKGAKIAAQLMHCGRIAHPLNQPEGARTLAPSAIAVSGKRDTEQEGPLPLPAPQAMTAQDIRTTIDEHVQAARNAIAAGFDIVELYGANGYLVEQFIHPHSNVRTDSYGGSIENRARFMLELTDAIIAEIGKDKFGIRLSPYGTLGDLAVYDGIDTDYRYIAQQLNQREMLYLHLGSCNETPDAAKAMFREEFKNILILSSGYDLENAVTDLDEKKGDLIAFARHFLANPDLPARWKAGAPLNDPDYNTLFSADAKGYTDYRP